MPELEISNDDSRLDVDVIHSFLRDSHRTKGIPRNVVVKSLAGSLQGDRAVGDVPGVTVTPFYPPDVDRQQCLPDVRLE